MARRLRPRAAWMRPRLLWQVGGVGLQGDGAGENFGGDVVMALSGFDDGQEGSGRRGGCRGRKDLAADRGGVGEAAGLELRDGGGEALLGCSLRPLLLARGAPHLAVGGFQIRG